jgi:hypothetical protein
VNVVVYNLGYCPGGDHSITTKSETTIESLKSVAQKLRRGGLISVCCYRGHPEGSFHSKIEPQYHLIKESPHQKTIYVQHNRINTTPHTR